MTRRTTWFQRNEQAEALEAEGKLDAALALYQANAREGCDVGYTYMRLADLYRQRGEREREIEALRTVVALEQQRGPTSRLIRLQERLCLSEELHERERTRKPQRAPRDAAPLPHTALPQKKKQGCLSSVAVLALLGASGLYLLF